MEKIMKNQIIKFVEEVKANKSINSFDEISTKQGIVLKLLFLLGWDSFNIKEVCPEYSVKSLRVDYSLRVRDINKAFIEVKKPLEDLEKHQEQLLKYSFQEGIKLAILTNGITWWFYLPLNEGNWEQRRFYSIGLLTQDVENIASKFMDFISKENIVTGKSLKIAENLFKSQQKKNIIKDTLPKAWNKIISDPDELFVELLSETAEKLCGYRADDDTIHKFLFKNKDNWLAIKPSPKPPIKRKKISLTGKKPKIKLSEKYTGKTLSSFSFRGKKHNVNYWIEILISLCNILASERSKDFDKVLELIGRKRPYFTFSPNELRTSQRIEGTNIYVETNLSSNQIVKISLNMISLFGYSADDLQIEAH
jgi:hypothetical protein